MKFVIITALGLLTIAAASSDAEPGFQDFEVAQAHAANLARLATRILQEARVPVDEMLHVFDLIESATRLPRSNGLKGKRALRGECAPGQDTCCPDVQEYSWEELGMDGVVVAPMRFWSVACVGKCSNANWLSRMLNRVPTDRCRPAKYEDQQVVYMTADLDIGKKTIADFYTTKCSCA